MVLFVGLFLQLNWLQIVHAPALEANPLNSRAVVKEFTAKRGDIVSADGTTLATSVPTNDQFKYLRKYPTGALFAADHRVLLLHLRLRRGRAHLRQGADG